METTVAPSVTIAFCTRARRPGAHVDDAFHPVSRRHGAVATPCMPAPVSAITRCPAPGHEGLVHGVVHLVGAGVVQVRA